MHRHMNPWVDRSHIHSVHSQGLATHCNEGVTGAPMTFIILPTGKEATSRDRSPLAFVLIHRPGAHVELLLVYTNSGVLCWDRGPRRKFLGGMLICDTSACRLSPLETMRREGKVRKLPNRCIHTNTFMHKSVGNNMCSLQ